MIICKSKLYLNIGRTKTVLYKNKIVCFFVVVFQVSQKTPPDVIKKKRRKARPTGDTIPGFPHFFGKISKFSDDLYPEKFFGEFFLLSEIFQKIF